MKKSLFHFYPGEWLESQGVSMLTLEEEGAYLRLLCYCWQHGSIPADPEKIARLIGKGSSTTLATTVASRFQEHSDDPSLLVHAKLQMQRAMQDAWKEKCREGGRKSAEKRKNLKGCLAAPVTAAEGCLPNSANKIQKLQPSSTSNLAREGKDAFKIGSISKDTANIVPDPSGTGDLFKEMESYGRLDNQKRPTANRKPTL
jgi:uncharacterized protein YdaU (DUF1376 family)